MSAQPVNIKRRALLATTLAALTVQWGGWLRPAQAKPDARPVDANTRWGMLIDAAKCVDCDVCVDACNDEHGLLPADGGDAQTNARWIRKLEVRERGGGRVAQLPMLCQHCEDPPCVDVCPTGASFRRADGVVLVDKHTCIGCRYCVLACPYQARSFIHENLRDQKPHSPRGKGTVESCTFCAHRIDRDETPACVEACARDGNGAMLFGDLHSPQSEIARRMQTEPNMQARADLNLNTAVRYQNV